MKPLLLLHGALGSQEQLKPLQQALAADYDVHTLSFKGHGGSEIPNEFSIATFAGEVIAWMEQKQFASISIMGYSMGGFVALYLAKHYPQHIQRIATLGTKLYWDEATATREVAMLNAGTIQQKLPQFAAELEQRHAPADWKLLLQRTADLLTSLGQDNPLPLQDYQHLTCPVLLMLGDRDKMVSLHETLDVLNELKHGQLAVLPNTPHPIERVNLPVITCILQQFL